MSVKFIKKMIAEEYQKRVAMCLLESEMQIKTKYGVNVWENADQLKIRHNKTGLEFTFGSFVGKDKVKLYLPEESRFEVKMESLNSILEDAQIDGDSFFYDDGGYVDYNRNARSQNDFKKQKNIDKRNYIIVSIDYFQKEFSY